MPLACFPPKVVSPIKIQIMPPKTTQEAPGTTKTTHEQIWVKKFETQK